MKDEFIKNIKDDVNCQYFRETLLNYAMNRWGLNKSASAGKMAELIRKCQPKNLKEWEEYYFTNAVQNKRNGIKISREYITNLGKELYIKISETIQKELISITEEECISYVYNLVVNRTYSGYKTEIYTIFGYLEKELNLQIMVAPDEWDRKYSVDFYIEVKKCIYIGLQIKPISGLALDYYNIKAFNENNNRKFTNLYKGKVFYIFSEGSSKNKSIKNIEVVDEIKQEIKRLKEANDL